MVAEKKKPLSEDEQDSSSEEDSNSEEESESNDTGEESSSDSDEENENTDDDNDTASPEKVEKEEEKLHIKPMVSASGEQCTFDLRNLLAINSHQVEIAKLYSTRKTVDKEINIPPTSDFIASVNEDHLLQKATDGCAQLINALWQLPTEKSDVGSLVILPSYSVTKLPRQLPPPPPKQETKWEKFAKARGIPLNKEKRSQKVWDEASGTWKFRHGYNKANDDAKEWPIMEIKDNEDPYEDPWERLRAAKHQRVDKNTLNRMKNAEQAGALPKGSARRVMKSREKNKAATRDAMLPVGVPVDLKGRKGSDQIDAMKRGRKNTVNALIATQRSTASLGKFDAMREGEPERKKGNMKKRKFESATDRKVTSAEADRSIKVLNAVVNTGGKQRDIARKKGRLAKGETAYDYEFDDGLGPSTFKKKKGRAGAGKMKKITKKRIL